MVRIVTFVVVVTASAALVVFALPRQAARGAQPVSATAPAGEPGVFMAGVVRLVAENRYDAAWLVLHPRQQRLVPRSRYVSCEQRSPIPGHVASIRVLSVHDEEVLVPGAAQALPGKAIAIRIAIADASVPKPVVVVHTYHAVAVGGQWRWFLPAERLAAYRAGLCPGYAPPTRPGPSA